MLSSPYVPPDTLGVRPTVNEGFSHRCRVRRNKRLAPSMAFLRLNGIANIRKARSTQRCSSLHYSLMVLMTLDWDRALLLIEYLSCPRTISSYFANVTTGCFGTICTTV